MGMTDWHRDHVAFAQLVPDFHGAQLVLALQPVHMANGHGIAFHEGLARLRDTSGKIVTPDRFLPALEADGTIAQLDRLVLRRVAALMMRDRTGRYSINISGRTIGDQDWLATLRSLAATRQDVADRLIVEVTESALYDRAIARDFLLEIRRLGPTILLDDFGAGYTAILQIRDLPLDGLKFDGAFSKGIHRDPDLQCLIGAMCAIAGHFDMLTVAEYVETAEDAACLRRLGVHALQGHYFAPATVPGADLSRLSAC